MLPLYFSKEVVAFSGSTQKTTTLTATATCIGVMSLFRAYLSFEGFKVKILAMRKEVS